MQQVYAFDTECHCDHFAMLIISFYTAGKPLITTASSGTAVILLIGWRSAH